MAADLVGDAPVSEALGFVADQAIFELVAVRLLELGRLAQGEELVLVVGIDDAPGLGDLVVGHAGDALELVVGEHGLGSLSRDVGEGDVESLGVATARGAEGVGTVLSVGLA